MDNYQPLTARRQCAQIPQAERLKAYFRLSKVKAKPMPLYSFDGRGYSIKGAK